MLQRSNTDVRPADSRVVMPAVLAVWLLLLQGCASGPELSPNQARNEPLLREVNRAGDWFHAKKTRPIHARLLEQDETITTLEGPVAARAGDYLCRGAAGELWPQKAANLEAKYTATETTEAGGWRQYVPRPDAEGVMATPVARDFQVHTGWGVLTGKPGDYLLKNWRDREVGVPEDVWLVDRQLFDATYAPVRP